MASPTNVIHFQGLDITLPLSVGIAYEPGIGLVLDFGSGFSGKLTLKATEGAQGLASSAYTPLQPIAQQLASAAEPDTGAASHMDLDDPIPAGDSDGNASAIVETPADQKGAAGAEPGGKENHTPGRQVDGPQAASGSKEKRSLGPWTGGSVPPSSKRQRSSEFTLRWRPLEAKGWEGQLPPERWGATFTALDDTQLCLFGGAHLGDAHLGDTWTFQVADAQWQRLAAEDYAGKAWHTAQLVDTLQGKQLVVFGGERLLPSDGATQGPTQEEEEDEVQVLHEVSILDTEAQLWVSMPVTGDGGKAPPLRTGHSTTLLPDGRVLMFGGTDGEGKHKNDLYVVDPKRLNWFGLSGIVRGAPPKPRAYHTATLVGKRVIVLGGAGSRTWSLKEVYSLHVEGWKWTEHTSEVDGEPPCARSGHSAIALPDGRHLLTYGGWAGESEVCYSDVAILDTQTWRWTTPRVEGVARPSGRAGHATALVHLEGGRSVLLLHGGRSKDDKLCRDTWVLELPASST
ncbi:hypothetical protein WJX72_004117 [[Myrmecia] bisecta]|uniref:LOV domain-containing protein n=1 Tax=[Myrmecia] bisecta TaxID=41462 RepID=A0AAW1Q3Y2_9CHLO